MEQNQETRTYGDESQMYESREQMQSQPQDIYNPYMQRPTATVKDVFGYIVAGIVFLRIVLSLISSMMSVSVLTYESVISGEYLTAMNTGMFTVISGLLSVSFIAYVVFVILDIVQISKAKYKITGLILFAIFLNFCYFLWRAHVLKQKKTIPVIYTVVCVVLTLLSVVVTLVYTYQLTTSIMNMM